MQINVIETPSVDTFDFLIFPEQHQKSQNYIFQQLSSYVPTLTDVGRKFMETSKSIYDKFNDSNVIKMAKATLRAAKGIMQPNLIRHLHTLEDIQSAQPVMQRYIMAQPDLRQVYLEQRCDGYSDTYVDLHPGHVGEEHYDYRRVMDHVVVETVDKDGNDIWCVKSYAEDLIEGDRELTHDEKVDVLLTWDSVKAYLDSRNDPTNIFGGQIAG